MPGRRSWLEGGLWLALGALTLAALGLHARRCAFPYQLVPSEAGLLMSMRALEQGWDPWAPDKAYEHSNTYGIAFPWLAAKLRPLAPALRPLVFLRLVSAAAIFLALALLFVALKEEGVQAREAWAACLAVYCGLLFYDTLSARPDALAVLCYIASLVLASRPGRAGPLAAGLLAAAGFFVKPYALLAAPLAGVLLLAQGRRRDAAWAAASALVCAAALLALVLHFSPAYLQGTSLLHQKAIRLSLGHWAQQCWQLLQTNAPFAAAGLAGLLLARRRGRPLLPQRGTRAWAWTSLAAFAALAAGPGAHPGAFLRHFHQLWLPLAVLAGTAWLVQLGFDRRWLALALVLDAGSALHYARANAPSAREVRLDDWRQVESWIAGHPRSDVPALFLSIVVDKGGLVTDTDHNQYLWYLPLGGPLHAAAQARRDEQVGWMEQGRLDSVISVTPQPGQVNDSLRAYRAVGSLCLASPLGWGCYTFFVPSGLFLRHKIQR